MEAYYLRQCKDAGTLERLGDIETPQQMEGQFRRLKTRLYKRLVAADDCVSLDMGLMRGDDKVSLNAVAIDRADRYKSDWWAPEVMHLAIVLRSVRLTWTEPRNYCLLWQRPADGRENTGWVCPWPFTVETLLLLWPDWTDNAMDLARQVAEGLLRFNSSPPLRGMKNVQFQYPEN
jgi:hypothetical protein